MSRMLQALRQLEEAKRQQANDDSAQPVEPNVDETGNIPANVASEAKLPDPIPPQTEPHDLHDEHYEPTFTSWDDVNDCYQVEDAASFTSFLEDSDAKRAAGAVPEGDPAPQEDEASPAAEVNDVVEQQSLPLPAAPLPIAPAPDEVANTEARVSDTLDAVVDSTNELVEEVGALARDTTTDESANLVEATEATGQTVVDAESSAAEDWSEEETNVNVTAETDAGEELNSHVTVDASEEALASGFNEAEDEQVDSDFPIDDALSEPKSILTDDTALETEESVSADPDESSSDWGWGAEQDSSETEFESTVGEKTNEEDGLADSANEVERPDAFESEEFSDEVDAFEDFAESSSVTESDAFSAEQAEVEEWSSAAGEPPAAAAEKEQGVSEEQPEAEEWSVNATEQPVDEPEEERRVVDEQADAEEWNSVAIEPTAVEAEHDTTGEQAGTEEWGSDAADASTFEPEEDQTAAEEHSVVDEPDNVDAVDAESEAHVDDSDNEEADAGETETPAPSELVPEPFASQSGEADEFSWDELFPGESSSDLGTTEATAHLDDKVDSLGDAEADTLVESESTNEANNEVAESPSPNADTESDHEAFEDAADTDSQKPPPAFSPAEAAALADLKREELLQQYRDLATRIRSELAEGQHACAAFVSAEHQPHVTDSLLRTAIAGCVEDDDKHVLIIDADFSDKNLTTGMEASAEFGLSEILKGRVPWQQAVRATGTPGLCLLPAGRVSPPKAEDGDIALANLLNELTCQWDLVLVDAGSAEDSATANALSAARNVYLVVRLGETEHAAAQAAVKTIRSTGATLRGSVVTNA